MEWVAVGHNNAVHLSRKVGDVEVFCIDHGGKVSDWRDVSVRAQVNGIRIHLECHGFWDNPDAEADRRAVMLADKLQRICALLEEP